MVDMEVACAPVRMVGTGLRCEREGRAATRRALQCVLHSWWREVPFITIVNTDADAERRWKSKNLFFWMVTFEMHVARMFKC